MICRNRLLYTTASHLRVPSDHTVSPRSSMHCGFRKLRPDGIMFCGDARPRVGVIPAASPPFNGSFGACEGCGRCDIIASRDACAVFQMCLGLSGV
jgi:hypothetical protein